MRVPLSMFLFKLINGKLLDYFPQIFTYEEVEYGYDFRNPHSLIFPSTRTFSAEDSIRYFLPTFMSSMPQLITDKIDTHSIGGFSSYSKKYFLNKYQAECLIPNCYVCNS